jgi:hypothetical protein
LDEEGSIYQQVFARQPTFSDEMQNQNPLLKRIYKLKLSGTQASKDPTVLRETEKQAYETIKSMV